MVKNKLINAPKEFVEWMRKKYPNGRDPDRLNKLKNNSLLFEELTKKNKQAKSKQLNKTLNEMLFGR